MNRHFNVGDRLKQFQDRGKSPAITQVVLHVDDVVSYASPAQPTDVGTVIEANCPSATQAMVDAIYARLKGLRYQGFSAKSVDIPIDLELGDSVVVRNVHGMIAERTLTFGTNGVSDLEAPSEDFLNKKYTYVPESKREYQRRNADLYSLIEKNSERITFEVGKISDDLADVSKQFTELKITVDGVTITDNSGTTKIRGSSIETETLKVQSANIEGDLTASTLQGDTINVMSSTGTIYGKISLTQDSSLYILSGVLSGFLLGGTDTSPTIRCLGTLYAEDIIADNIQARLDELENRIEALEG